MWQVDCGTCSVEDANRPFEARLELTAERDGQFNALAAWFDARLSENIDLSNGPGNPDTHWGRTIFPAGRVVDLTAGKRVRLRFLHEPKGKGKSQAAWEIRTDDYRFSSSDLTTLTR
jgi:hypothetical protein